jgi:uncharacterized membrane protein
MQDAQISTATAPDFAPKRMDVNIVRWLGVLLVITVWASAGLFGLYIIAFYALALLDGNMVKWNEVLPGLYEEGSRAATSGIGMHFAMGGIILILGSIQLVEALRVRYSAFHRWVGRVYVVASLFTAMGGLIFIVIKGTIGGLPMDIGFGLYGVLMLVAGVETYRHAAAGRYEQHRAWALRLYALAIGSWLYRMDYGFWFMLAGKLGHTSEFNGLFDRIMAFFFYIPNLLVAEVFIRQRKYTAHAVINILSAILLLLMTAFLLTGTYFFTKFYWGPAIIGMFGIGE